MKKIIGMALCLSMTAMLFTGCCSSGSGGADKKDSSGNNKVGIRMELTLKKNWKLQDMKLIFSMQETTMHRWYLLLRI